MAFRCEKCGKRLGSKAELPGHMRRAHSDRSGRAKTEALHVAPTRSEIVRPRRKFVAAKPIRAQVVKVEWLALDPRFYPPQTALVQREERMRERSALVRRDGSHFFSREGVSEALLYEQWHVLEAMRSRLVRGAGGPGDRERFLAALDVYKQNGSMLRSSNLSKMLPRTIE